MHHRSTGVLDSLTLHRTAIAHPFRAEKVASMVARSCLVSGDSVASLAEKSALYSYSISSPNPLLDVKILS